MRRYRSLSFVLLFVLLLLPVLVTAQAFDITGTAPAATGPTTAYVVQAQDVKTLVTVQTPLTDKREFTLTNLNSTSKYLIQLVDTRSNHIVCTKGPMTAPQTKVTIACGGSAAGFLWLVSAIGGGVAAAIAIGANGSPSR